MLDAHNHLQFAAFDDDRERVIERAADVGVRAMVLAGYDDQRRELARSVADAPGIGATAGLHPWAVDDSFETQLEALEQLDWTGFCGLGELGLDWVRAGAGEDRDRQVVVLRRQLSIARELDLPIVLHCVRANDELAKWLRTDGVPSAGGIVHSFWGSAQQAENFLSLGLDLSIGPQITHTQPGKMIDAVRAASIERLVVETDAPSRPPAGSDLERSEPAFLSKVVTALASALDEPAERVSQITEANARRIFGIKGCLAPA